MVRKGVGTDSRIGAPFLYPGIGYGGSCFPKDVKAIGATAREHGYTFRILEAVEDVNENQKHLMVEKVVSVFGEDLSGRTFAVWGLAFKPNTDDMREAAAITVIRGLLERGAQVRAFDPEAHETAAAVLGDSIEYCDGPYQALEGSDALVLCTEWSEFRRPDFDRMGELLQRRLIFDGRNIYSAKTMQKHGFERHGVGIPPVKP
jgi:UDPglucose 6-dehydrogenase